VTRPQQDPRSAGLRRGLTPWGRERRPARLRAGTEQARLLAALQGHVKDLRSLRASTHLPDALTDPAIEALVAASGSCEVAVAVARAVDGLDAALERAHAVGQGGPPPTAASAAALARMYDRRAGLLAALHDALAQVQELHGELLELSATVELYGLGDAEVLSVKRRLQLLRQVFTDIQAGGPWSGGPLP
jgi:hypothetical protein